MRILHVRIRVNHAEIILKYKPLGVPEEQVELKYSRHVSIKKTSYATTPSTSICLFGVMVRTTRQVESRNTTKCRVQQR